MTSTGRGHQHPVMRTVESLLPMKRKQKVGSIHHHSYHMSVCTWAWCSNTVVLVRNYMTYHPNRSTSKNEKKFWSNRCKWRLAKVNQEVKFLQLGGHSPQAALSSLSSQVFLSSCWTLHNATLLPYDSSWSWSISEGRLMVSLVTYTSLENKNLIIIIASVH